MEVSQKTKNTATILLLLLLLLKSLQSCPTLCDPRDGSPPGSPVPGILQARTLEWVAISFSNAWKWKVKVKSLSCVWLFVTPWTAAYQAPPPMGFSRQEYWSGLPSPSPLSTFTPALFPVCSSFPLPAPSLYYQHLVPGVFNSIYKFGVQHRTRIKITACLLCE